MERERTRLKGMAGGAKTAGAGKRPRDDVAKLGSETRKALKANEELREALRHAREDAQKAWKQVESLEAKFDKLKDYALCMKDRLLQKDGGPAKRDSTAPSSSDYDDSALGSMIKQGQRVTDNQAQALVGFALSSLLLKVERIDKVEALDEIMSLVSQYSERIVKIDTAFWDGQTDEPRVCHANPTRTAIATVARFSTDKRVVESSPKQGGGAVAQRAYRDANCPVARGLIRNSALFNRSKVTRYAFASVIWLLGIDSIWETVRNTITAAAPGNGMASSNFENQVLEEWSDCLWVGAAMVLREKCLSEWIKCFCREARADRVKGMQAFSQHAWRLPEPLGVKETLSLCLLKSMVEDTPCADKKATIVLAMKTFFGPRYEDRASKTGQLGAVFKELLESGAFLSSAQVSSLFSGTALVAQAKGWDWTYHELISRIFWPAMGLPPQVGASLTFRLIAHLARSCDFCPRPCTKHWEALAERINSKVLRSRGPRESLSEFEKVSLGWIQACQNQLKTTIVHALRSEKSFYGSGFN